MSKMRREDRMEEELYCLATWLSLNVYEERARKLIVEDMEKIINMLPMQHSWYLVGSAKSGLLIWLDELIV